MWIAKFIKHLISINPGKISSIVLILILSIVVNNTESSKVVTKPVIYYYENGTDFVYLTKSGNTYSAVSLINKVPIVNNSITYNESNDVYVISWAILIVVSIGLGISLLIGGDAGFEFIKCRIQADIDTIECEEKDNIVNIIFKNKLIKQIDIKYYEPSRYLFKDLIEDFYRCGPNLYPTYYSTINKRDNKIKQLLK